MRRCTVAALLAVVLLLFARTAQGQAPTLVVDTKAFGALVNPNCSHCVDEAKRRAGELRDNDRVLCWLRGYSEGGAIPFRFFLSPYRVISDSYGIFVYDPDAGYARGFGPSFHFRFHGWRNGVMVMRDDQDGTLYSCLSGLAFDGPKKGTRLISVPTLLSDWGSWLKRYPQAVTYHMFDKYQPVELPTAVHPGSLRSRGKVDGRLPGDTAVLGVWDGRAAQAYPLELVAKAGLIADEQGCKKRVVLWDAATRTAAAYEPEAAPPRQHKAPRPNADGVSPSETAADEARQPLTLVMDSKNAAAPFVDRETGSRWDVAGRAVEGKLKDWTLTWLDSTQAKWFAWAAEYPETTIHDGKSTPDKSTPEKPAPAKPTKVNDAIKEVAGTAEFLRNVPKKFGTLHVVDAGKHAVTLLLEGDKEPTTWTLTRDAELKVGGWWGRLEQFPKGERVWAWFTTDRSKKPKTIFMLADRVSEQEIHGLADAKLAKAIDVDKLDAHRTEQRAWLRKLWLSEGLPGTIGFLHVYSGETDVLLDHEALRWARTLSAGDKVELAAQPAIKAVVKSVAAQREKTQVRLVIHSLDLADLATGQRVHLRMKAPSTEVETALVPPDIDRPKSKEERIEWFLANMYCTCSVGNDICTGHFYTLASCNPNGCALPNFTRRQIGKLIDDGKTNRQIFEELRSVRGEAMLRPHLLK